MEVSEDFSVDSQTATIDVQVKSSEAATGPRAVSLNTPHVKQALSRFWQRSTAGSGKRCELIFIANGAPARERGFDFPGGVPGLEYWGRAALLADTQPLRRVLLELSQDDALTRWLATEPSDEEFRERLLKRVRWALRAMPADDLAVEVRERLSNLYVDKGFPVRAVDSGLKLLQQAVFDTACETAAENRKLTQSDLHRIVETEQIPALLAHAAVLSRAAAASDASVEGILVSSFIDPPDAASDPARAGCAPRCNVSPTTIARAV